MKVLFLFCVSFIFTNKFLFSNEERETLRKKIMVEKNYSDGFNHDRLDSILDNRCGLHNYNGICYFNTVMQCLFGNKDLLMFYVLNDFAEDLVVSNLLQGLAIKMITNKSIDPITYLKKLSNHPGLTSCCRSRGGDPLVFFNHLLYILAEEISDSKGLKHEKGSPNSFFNLIKTTSVCVDCQHKNMDLDLILSVNIPFTDTTKDSLDFYRQIRECKNKYKYYQCKKCDAFRPAAPSSVFSEFVFARNLVIAIKRVSTVNSITSMIEQNTTIFPELILNNNKYQLYALITPHKTPDGNHVNCIVYKKNRWVVFNDLQFGYFPPNYINNELFNRQGWVLFYRRLEK